MYTPPIVCEDMTCGKNSFSLVFEQSVFTDWQRLRVFYFICYYFSSSLDTRECGRDPPWFYAKNSSLCGEGGVGGEGEGRG